MEEHLHRFSRMWAKSGHLQTNQAKGKSLNIMKTLCAHRRIRNPMLYPFELRALGALSLPHPQLANHSAASL